MDYKYKFEGEVSQIMDLQTFESGFKKREIIVTSDDQYPQDIKFEFLRDDVDMLKSIKVNQRVLVTFTLRGNEYNGKFYNNLIALGITKKKKVVKAPPELGEPEITDIPPSDDDLPF